MLKEEKNTFYLLISIVYRLFYVIQTIQCTSHTYDKYSSFETPPAPPSSLYILVLHACSNFLQNTTFANGKTKLKKKERNEKLNDQE